MGYNTWFDGEFTISPELKEEDITEWEKLWSEWITFSSNNKDSSVPGDWPCWDIDTFSQSLAPTHEEKTYGYIDWLEYVVENFFKPRGYLVNGEVEWYGDDREDRGILRLANNKLSIELGHWVWNPPISVFEFAEVTKIQQYQAGKTPYAYNRGLNSVEQRLSAVKQS